MVNISELRKINRLYRIKTEYLDSPEEWIEYLESVLHGQCSVMEIDGKLELLEIKARVFSIHGMTISIYPNDHSPPHFHIKTADIDASFLIKDCTLLHGDIPGSKYSKLLYWFENGGKEKCIGKWDETRPTNCTVGRYED